MSEESRRGEGGSAAGHAGEPGAVSAGPPAHVMDTLERTVQRILQVGIAVSFALMAAGLVIALASGDELTTRVVPPDGLAAGIASLDSAAFVSLGLIVLIATPFVRVAGSLLAFARLRDRRYALVTAAVLAVMCVSVLIGTT